MNVINFIHSDWINIKVYAHVFLKHPVIIHVYSLILRVYKRKIIEAKLSESISSFENFI